jgi:hypothetical protein
MKVVPYQVYKRPNSDFCLIRLDGLAPSKDLSKYLIGVAHALPSPGFYIRREEDGSNSFVKFDCLRRGRVADPDVKTKVIDAWFGFADSETACGNCGMHLVLETPTGPALGGTHFGGARENNYCVASVVCREFYEQAIAELRERSVSLCVKQGCDIVARLVPQLPPVPEAGSVTLSAPSAKYTMVDLHPKSPVRFIKELGELEVFGSLNGFRSSHTSDVEQSPMFSFFKRHDFVSNKCAPDLSTWRPKRIALLDSVAAQCCLDQEVLDSCVYCFANEILSEIDKVELRNMEPLSWEVAINGCPGVAYIDPINKSTSCGFPWRLPKTFLLSQRSPTIEERDLKYDTIWDMKPELYDRVDDLVRTYLDGRCAHPVFCAQLKDEPVSEEKAKVGKTRVFVAAPVDFTLLVRKILLPFVRLVQNNKFLFEAGPGTAAQSQEWEEIYRYLTQFGTDRLVAGDYSAFDKKMAAQVVRAALNLILIICVASGAFTADDLKILSGICADVNFPVCDFFGDLIRFLGTNPSGWPLTVILNGIVNSLYMRYAYFHLNPAKEVRSFKKNVALMTYGDDNSAGVSASAPWFNHTAISEVLSGIGVKYTMADKKTESVPYIPIGEVSFLKRKWRWEPEVGCHVCPIEIETIKKQLSVWVKSKVLSPKAHCVNCLFSAHWELFFHGREFFDHWDPIFRDCVVELHLDEWMPERGFPSWDDYVAKWRRDSTMFVSSLAKVPLFAGLVPGSVLCGAFSQTMYQESCTGLRNSLMTAIISPVIEEVVRYYVGKRWGWKASACVVGGLEFLLFVGRKAVDESFFPGFTCTQLALARLVPLLGHIALSYFGKDAPLEAACAHVSWNSMCVLPQLVSALMGVFFQDEVYKGLCLLHKQGVDGANWPRDFDCGAPWCASWHVVLCQEPKEQTFSSYLLRTILENVSSVRERIKSYNQGQSPKTLFKVAVVGAFEQSPTFDYEYKSEGKNLLAETLINFDEHEAPVVVGSENTTSVPHPTSGQFSDWFKRPILIKTIKWSEGTNLDEKFFPWDLYFNTKGVNEKLRGFCRLRSKLHLKFVVNCSPFRYSKVLVSYHPLGKPDKTDYAGAESLTSDPFPFSGGQVNSGFTISSGTYSEQALLAHSQRPHAFMDMSKSEGCEMVLPFLYHSEWLDATGSVATRPTGPTTALWFSDLQRMGSIRVESFIPLRTVTTASTDKTTISVYAWSEDLELAGPTIHRQGKDDYENRPVSTLASAIAAATGALSNVPVIGPYMRASSMVASTLGSLARWFGFSNPPVIDSVKGVKMMSCANLSSPEISTQVEKLTMDPKQETDIDPRTVGAPPHDELTIQSFAGRMTYIFGTDWYTYDDQNTLLASLYVVPEYYYGNALTTGATNTISTVAFQCTPLAHVCQWFRYWRGSMKYHIKIVKTQFHKGRLRITYDPAGTYTNFEEGKLHTMIVDIAETDEFDFEVPYMAVLPWLKTTQTPYVVTNSKFFNSRGSPGPTYDDTFMNGIVRVEVLNELGSMDSTAAVRLLIFSAGGSDFELASPLCFNEATTTDVSYSIPYNLEGHELMECPKVSEKTISSTMGESIVSMRQLLHRSVLYTTLCLPTDATAAGAYMVQNILPRLPVFAGAAPFPDLPTGNATTKSLHKTSTGKYYNYTAMSPLPYLSCCFVGQRGSVVYRCNNRATSTSMTNLHTQYLGRVGKVVNTNDGVSGTLTAIGGTGPSMAKTIIALIDSSAAGIVSQDRNAGWVEAVVPHYSQWLMLPGNPDLVFGCHKNGSKREQFGLRADGIELDTAVTATAPKYLQTDIFVSAGVDTQLFHFLNVPTLYVTTTPTAGS